MSGARQHPAAQAWPWGIAALLLLFFSQRAALADLFGAWQTEEYSHGILIPFIALLLAWHRLAEIKPPARPSWLGIAWLAAGGAFQLVAVLSAFLGAAEYGFIISLAGLSLAFLGRPAARAIAPALFYLLFAVPLPHLVQADLSERLQLISSTLGVMPLDLMGIPVFQQGNVIDLGSLRLQVVEACSGLRYLFPLMSFGYLVAFLLKDRWWKKIVLFLSTIPITIGLNALRIAFIGLTVDLWGAQMAEGFIHSFEGWSVFLVCVALLLGEARILMRIGPRGRFRYEYLGRARGKLFSGRVKLKAPGIAAVALTALFAFAFGSGAIAQRAEIIPSHPPLTSFPLALGAWRGQPDSFEPDVLQALKLDDYWLADYRRPGDAAPVNLYIGYYASQRTGAMTHSPSNCIPGGGWQIESSRVEKFDLSKIRVKLTRLLIRRGDQAELVYYWFDERGRDLTETYSAKWYLLRDSIVMHRTDGALIRLTTPVAPDENEEAAEKRLNDFLGPLLHQIEIFIPGSNTIAIQ